MNAVTINNDTISVTTEYTKQDIWNALVGSDFAGLTYWVQLISDKDGYGIGNTPTDIYINHTEPTTGDTTQAIITPEMIYKSFGKLLLSNTTHCGNYSLSDLDDSDSCFADLVLQHALFNQIVFG